MSESGWSPVDPPAHLSAHITRRDLNQHVGTELAGFRLLDLDADGVAWLVRLIAERGVVAVRDQPMTIEQQIAFGARMGPLHVHPAYADPAHPEALRIHTDANSRYTAGEGWHSDVSCDLEPPGISMLRIEVVPSAGGDTAFASMHQAWATLSAPMRGFLQTCEAIHAGDLPWRGAYGSTSPKDFPVNVHPVVRTHPLTGRPALYVNSGFTDRIKGLGKHESDALLAMLFDHVARGVGFQCRVRWEANTVTFWDNRVVQHHASWDYFPETRSGWRVTTRGERPFFAGANTSGQPEAAAQARAAG
ncbi:MAG: TauD/TfdA dioxygenase family protein [Gammaproteobacteria bacterium]